MIDEALQFINDAPKANDQDVDFDGLDARQVFGARDDGRVQIVDHTWLDGKPGPQPFDWKQGQPPLDMQDELARLWIEDRPQGGAWLVPTSNRVPSVSLTPKVAARPAEVSAAIARAVRRIHLGKRASEVYAELATSVGVRLARAMMPLLKADEGLAGRVFIREAAFPGLRQGRWDSLVRKMASTARYLVSSVPADGFRKHGLEVVSEVPWREALEAYQPRLRARGVRLGGDPREALRQAFAAEPAQRASSRRVPGKDPAPARPERRAADPVKSPDQLRAEQDARMARRVVRMQVRKGQISEAQAADLLDPSKTTAQVYAELDRIAKKPREVVTYRGVADRYGAAQQAVRNMSLRPSETEKAPRNLADLKLRKRVAQLLLRGSITPAEARRVLSLPSEIARYAGDGVHFDPRVQAARDLSLVRFSDGAELRQRMETQRRRNAAVPQDDSALRLRKRVAQLLVRGEIDPEQARQVLGNGDKEGWSRLARYLARPGHLPRFGPAQSKVSAYKGSVYRAGGSYKTAEVQGLDGEGKAVERAAKAAGCDPADVARYVRWFRQASGRGISVEILRHEASIKFAGSVRRAAQLLEPEVLGGIHQKLLDREEGELPEPHHDPHETSFIPDAGWFPGGSR